MTQQPNVTQKRGSTSILILGACLLGAALGLFGLNIYHASECQSKSPNELEQYIEAINRRLLQAESQNIRNSVTMDKLLHLMQAKLGKLEHQELEEISQHSQDEAVRISMLLASQPAPPMPQFYMNSKYKDPEKLADAIDDKFEKYGSAADDREETSKFDDFKEESTITDADAIKACEEWKTQYSVAVGVSWGSLPLELQQKWMQYSCDYHLDISRNNPHTDDKELSGKLVTKAEYEAETTTEKDDFLKRS